MLFPNSLLRVSAAFVCAALLSACGCTGSSELRGETYRIDGPRHPVTSQLYGDATSATAGLVGASFGIVGGVVGGLIAASNAESGRKRWANVTQNQAELARKLVLQSLDRQFTQTCQWKPAAAGEPEVKFQIDRVMLGVQHVGKQRFAALLMVKSELAVREEDNKWDDYWDGQMAGQSTVAWTLPEYQADSKRFPAALQQAADALAAKIVQDF